MLEQRLFNHFHLPLGLPSQVMDVSSDESSYSAESMGSFDGEHFAGRSACSLVLSIYREKLLADDQLSNRATTMSFDQHCSVLVDQDNLAIMN